MINRWWSAIPFWWPRSMDVVRAEAHLNGDPLEINEYLSPVFHHRLWLLRSWGLWSEVAPLAPGQYVLDFKAVDKEGFWVDTTYHLTVT
ncbi:hypothetical protein ABZZ44_18030 [Streptomyces sp. NPDC006460]|uniref:hypothetical protein n=1 Tax=Streptomyces sp. NPDC006460 TaxID=3154304 RepID=UPI0033B78E44